MVGRFLVRTYGTKSAHINWAQPRWEYMHYHSLIRRVQLSSIGVWETNGEIVGVVHPEHSMGTAYFEFDPGYASLKEEMLEYAEAHISAVHAGVRSLRIYINSRDEDFQRVASEIGYSKAGGSEPISHLAISVSLPVVTSPKGFTLKSLAKDNDLQKIDRLLWRGFDHGDEPSAGGVADREFMQSAPNFRKDLDVVVQAAGGDFVSYCGMWYEPVNAIAYVEPVATDPDYRCLGLGRAAVLEGTRTCGALGADVA